MFEDRDGIVRLEFTHSIGYGARPKRLQDFLTNGVIDFCECGKIEVIPHQLD